MHCQPRQAVQCCDTFRRTTRLNRQQPCHKGPRAAYSVTALLQKDRVQPNMFRMYDEGRAGNKISIRLCCGARHMILGGACRAATPGWRPKLVGRAGTQPRALSWRTAGPSDAPTTHQSSNERQEAITFILSVCSGSLGAAVCPRLKEVAVTQSLCRKCCTRPVHTLPPSFAQATEPQDGAAAQTFGTRVPAGVRRVQAR